MDPNAALAELRALLTDDRETDADDHDRIAELVRALDTWISRGGFLPAAWNAASLDNIDRPAAVTALRFTAHHARASAVIAEGWESATRHQAHAEHLERIAARLSK